MGRVLFAAIIVGGLMLSSICFGYSGGSGTPEDPYLIATAEDMNQIGRNYQDWDKCFRLIADINLSAYTGTQFSRIGPDYKHAFSGVFDGNGHTISNFTYTAESGDYIGIFGNISTTGRIENVSLVDVNVTGRNYVGGLCGYSEGIISNCSSMGNITGRYSSGGLVGENGGTISDSNSTGNVTGGDYSYCLGGLVGYSDWSGNISNCNSTGDVAGGDSSYYLGGLVGGSSEGTISNCDSTGNITGGDYSYCLGGLVGNTCGTISNCDSTGNVTSGDESYDLGGLVGGNYWSTISYCYSTGAVAGGYDSDCVGGLVGENRNYSVVMDCYATGEVAGDYDVGGLVGMNDDSTITRCYSSGSVSGYMFIGGLLGWNYSGTTTDSFWDTNTSGQSWSAGGTGKATAEMKTESTFTDAGWDFVDVWHICEGGDYPKLDAFGKYSGGSGTDIDPYQIANVCDLLEMADKTSDYDKYFILTADIDLDPNLPGNRVFTTAVIAVDINNSNWEFDGTPFTGVLDGAGHKIINLTIDTNGVGNAFLGLFGCISNIGGEVKNLGMGNVNVIGRNDSHHLGGLAGVNYGVIVNCFTTGTVTGENNSYDLAGGLVGDNLGTISNCFSTNAVSGKYGLGGLVGWNDGNITDCYSTGAIVGGDDSYYLGGLTGGNYGYVNNCYSKGDVSGTSYLGGLVGYNDDGGGISNCNSTGAVTGGDTSQCLGGLVGWNESGSISNCYSTGTVNGLDYVGGLVGGSDDSTISNCYVTGTVAGRYHVGGLVGWNTSFGAISDCYAIGTVTGSCDVGGLVGVNISSGTISDCYATGTVTGLDCVGGLVGWNTSSGTISDCYATGKVTGSSNVGGLVGLDEVGGISSCYFLDTSGPNNGYGTPLMDEEMKQQGSFMGWDFTTIWAICEGTNYPRLRWQIPAADFTCPDGVDFIDFAILANAWLSDPTQVNWDGRCDIAEPPDNVIDILDLEIFAQNWLEGF